MLSDDDPESMPELLKSKVLVRIPALRFASAGRHPLAQERSDLRAEPGSPRRLPKLPRGLAIPASDLRHACVRNTACNEAASLLNVFL
nr:hypothetical protein [Methylobacterium sp. ZNC0032]